MTNEQIKNLLEKALQRSKNPACTITGGYDTVKLVIQIELIITMLEADRVPNITYRDIGDLK